MIEITNFRDNPLIDPHIEIWEFPVAAYLFLGGLVAGLMILNGVWRLSGKADKANSSLSIGPLWAPILLSLGMFFLWLDLAYKTHVYNFYLTFQIRSPMSWGAWILILVYPVQILGLALPGGLDKFGKPLTFLNPTWDFIKKIANKIPRLTSSMNIVLGVMLGIYTGILLSSFAARPLWNTALLGPLFLVSGLSTAAAFNMLFKPTDNELLTLGKTDIGLLATEFLFLVLFLIGLMTGTEGHQEAGRMLLGGAFTPGFWIFVISLGILLPLWLEIRETTDKYVPRWVAPILVLIGGLALRIIMVYAGQVSQIPDVELLSGEL